MYLFEFSVPSAGLAAAIGIMYNLLRAMTKPETMEYGLPFHLTYSLTMMVMLRFGTRDLNAALGQKILALRKEKDTKFRLAAFQRYANMFSTSMPLRLCGRECTRALVSHC